MGNPRVASQLVIIGNGFDLRCGLPSSYLDFYKDRRLCLSGQVSNLDTDGRAKHTETVWDYILADKKYGGWGDIENAMTKWLAPSKEKGVVSQDGVRGPLFCLSQRDAIQTSHEAIYSDTQRKVTQYLQARCERYDRNTVMSFHKKELSILEDDFRRYLLRAIEASEGYRDKASGLLFSLLGDGIPVSSDTFPNYSVLSFNYTRAADKYEIGFRDERRPIGYCNVHGELEGEVIFGIDGTGHLDKDDIAQFTKTFRIMGLRSDDATRGYLFIRPSIKVIKFFGHSLGAADYSYFQSIFDIVHLYEGSTSLVFYYCGYSRPDGTEVTDEQARNDMMNRVVKLLNSYGKSLDNEDHGKNLVHKLLLENRVRVRELPECKWEAGPSEVPRD